MGDRPGLPAAAVRAARDALWDEHHPEGFCAASVSHVAEDRALGRRILADVRAVLVAATERIECPACAVWEVIREGCPVCDGSGFLYVLKQETT